MQNFKKEKEKKTSLPTRTAWLTNLILWMTLKKDVSN